MADKWAHHVLHSLPNENKKNKLMFLLLSLDDSKEVDETAPAEASVEIITEHKRKNRFNKTTIGLS